MPTPEATILHALRDPEKGKRNLNAIAGHLHAQPGLDLVGLLARLLPRSADPDLALNNIERLTAQPAVRAQLPGLMEAKGKGLEAVLQLLATSEFFADTLVAYPEFLEAVRIPPRRHPSTAELTESLRSEVDAAADDAGVLRAFRRFRARHSLRVGINDIVRDRPLEEVTRELSRLADACLEVALASARKTVGARFGTPRVLKDARGDTPGESARVAVMAFGKLGGEELNYSSDIDLMFVYDADGETTGKHSGIANAEYFARVVTEVVRLLSSVTDRGFAYRVDLRLRPEGQRGPLARSLASTMSYYDTRGRTWERQALIKARQVAGDRDLGKEFLAGAESFVYRKYLSFAEINEVKALKRQMETRAARAGADDTDVKTGRGGIRDIEFTVQFLQLLNGGDSPAVRQRTTLLALDALEIAGCLTPQEVYILADAYRFLRKTEHRLQLLFDLQTHKLPSGSVELRKLALRMGYGSLQPQESAHRIDEPRSLDLIANYFLGDPTASWRLCDANNAVVPDALASRDLVGIPPTGRFDRMSTYQIYLGGQPADDAFYNDVVSLEVEESMDLPGAVQLTMPVNRTDAGDLTYLADARFGPMANLAVVATPSPGSGAGSPSASLGDVASALGVGGGGGPSGQCIFDGYVLSHKIHLETGNANSTVAVWGQDASWLMNLEEKAKEWVGVTDADVAGSIFGDYGITPSRRQPGRRLAVAHRVGALAHAAGHRHPVPPVAGPPQRQGLPGGLRRQARRADRLLRHAEARRRPRRHPVDQRPVGLDRFRARSELGRDAPFGGRRPPGVVHRRRRGRRVGRHRRPGLEAPGRPQARRFRGQADDRDADGAGRRRGRVDDEGPVAAPRVGLVRPMRGRGRPCPARRRPPRRGDRPDRRDRRPPFGKIPRLERPGTRSTATPTP